MEPETALDVLDRLKDFTSGGLTDDRILALHRDMHSFPVSIQVLIEAVWTLYRDNARLQAELDNLS